MKILVVDDEQGLRETLVALLSFRGHAVREAENGLAALNALLDFEADVIVSDWNMPVMGGADFVTKVRTRFPSIPILIVSACELTNSDILSPGAHALLPKPFSSNALFQAIEQLFAKGQEFSQALEEEDTSLADAG